MCRQVDIYKVVRRFLFVERKQVSEHPASTEGQYRTAASKSARVGDYPDCSDESGRHLGSCGPPTSRKSDLHPTSRKSDLHGERPGLVRRSPFVEIKEAG